MTPVFRSLVSPVPVDAVREHVPNYFPDKVILAISVISSIDYDLSSQEQAAAALASRVMPIGRDTTSDEVAGLVSYEEASTVTGGRLLEILVSFNLAKCSFTGQSVSILTNYTNFHAADNRYQSSKISINGGMYFD